MEKLLIILTNLISFKTVAQQVADLFLIGFKWIVSGNYLGARDTVLKMKQNFYKQNHLIEVIREPTLVGPIIWRCWNAGETMQRLNPKKSKKCSLDYLVYHYELTIKLIEAAWLLKRHKLGRLDLDDKQESDIAKWYIKTERKKLRDYPENLTIREIVKPSSVLKKMFRFYKLGGYKKILHTWLHNALSSSFIEESLSKSEVITVYEQLVKLFEATWLIRERLKAGN